MNKYDWKKIKQDYVTSSCTYADLIKKYGVSNTSLARMACKEEFVKSRINYRKKLEVKTAEKLIEFESDKLVSMCQASENMNVIITDITKNKEYFCTDNDVDVNKIEGVLNAIDTSVSTIRNLYGMRTIKEKDAYDLALKKLQVEQSKIVNESGQPSDCGVIYLPKMLDDKGVE